MPSPKDKMKAGLGSFFQQAREQHAASEGAEQTGVREAPPSTPREGVASPAAGVPRDSSHKPVESAPTAPRHEPELDAPRAAPLRASSAGDGEGDNLYRLHGEEPLRRHVEEVPPTAPPRPVVKAEASERERSPVLRAKPSHVAPEGASVQKHGEDSSRKKWYGTIDETYVRDRDGVETRKRSFTLSIELITEIERRCLSPKRSVNVWLEDRLREVVGLPPLMPTQENEPG